jgi:hypothetical protein
MKNVMRTPPGVLLALAVGLTAWPATPSAHFRLLTPTSWINTTALGDPQKVGPCGVDRRDRTRSC